MVFIGRKFNYKETSHYCEIVLRQLEKGILFGTYKPGDRLIEREIAEKLGVSRVPVREALMNLERWGFVKEPDGSRKGREVVAMTRKEIMEFYQMMVFMEIGAFSDCSLNNNQTLYQNLMEPIDKMDKAASNKDVETYRELNSSFHHEIAKCVNNRKLYKIYCDISNLEQWFQNLALYMPRLEQSNSEHKKILTGYKRQDLNEIKRLFNEHYSHAVEVLADKRTFSPGGNKNG